MPTQSYRMPAGTELHIPNSVRTGWKLLQYLTDDVIVCEASDGKQIQVNKNQVQLKMSMTSHRTKKQLK